jgi:hypothetical protein
MMRRFGDCLQRFRSGNQAASDRAKSDFTNGFVFDGLVILELGYLAPHHTDSRPLGSGQRVQGSCFSITPNLAQAKVGVV